MLVPYTRVDVTQSRYATECITSVTVSQGWSVMQPEDFAALQSQQHALRPYPHPPHPAAAAAAAAATPRVITPPAPIDGAPPAVRRHNPYPQPYAPDPVVGGGAHAPPPTYHQSQANHPHHARVHPPPYYPPPPLPAMHHGAHGANTPFPPPPPYPPLPAMAYATVPDALPPHSRENLRHHQQMHVAQLRRAFALERAGDGDEFDAFAFEMGLDAGDGVLREPVGTLPASVQVEVKQSQTPESDGLSTEDSLPTLDGIDEAPTTDTATAEDLEGDDVDPCPICFDTMNEGDVSARLRCGHVFHEACMRQWLAYRSHCCVCRAELDM